jgi:hypothetical protein
MISELEFLEYQDLVICTSIFQGLLQRNCMYIHLTLKQYNQYLMLEQRFIMLSICMHFKLMIIQDNIDIYPLINKIYLILILF